MFVDIRQDSVLLRRDTIEAILANERGEWIGHGISKYTMSLPYLEHVQVHEGVYEVVVQQGMREESLRGLTDIGLEIIKN
jgi:gliding motility-associated lipoprotein GldH